MPQGLVLIGPPELDAHTIRTCLPAEWRGFARPVREGPCDGIQLNKRPVHIEPHPDHSQWYVDFSRMSDEASAASDYSENEDLDEEFRSQVPGASIYSVSFDDYRVVRRLLVDLLRALPGSPSTYWVDDDYGSVWRGDRFLARLTESDWDWRRQE